MIKFHDYGSRKADLTDREKLIIKYHEKLHENLQKHWTFPPLLSTEKIDAIIKSRQWNAKDEFINPLFSNIKEGCCTGCGKFNEYQSSTYVCFECKNK